MALLALTVAASFAPLGPALQFVSYSIALAKAGLVVWVFMEMGEESGRHRLALTAGFVWAMFLFVMIASDTLTRGWLGG